MDISRIKKKKKHTGESREGGKKGIGPFVLKMEIKRVQGHLSGERNGGH